MKATRIALILFLFLAPLFKVKAQEPGVTMDINNVIVEYLGVKNALTIDNSAEAKERAKKLLAAIEFVPVAKLSADQRKIWSVYSEKLQFDSRHISESGQIEHQREHFASLSKNMYEVVKSLKLNAVALYEQYCPMKKATWISETVTIKNPYYGKAMLTCGKTTATLAAVAQ